MAEIMNREWLDVRGLIRAFGGPANLHRRLLIRGNDLSKKAVEKWSERKAIPHYWLGQMIAMAREDGHTLDLTQFMADSKDSDSSDPLL